MPFMPPIEWLRERFYLDSAGILRNARDCGRARVGEAVGTRHKGHGYVHVNVRHEGRQKKLAVHRVVWSLANGIAVPDEFEVDHRDRVRDHNLPDNLELKTHRDNMANTRFACLGVYRDPRNNRNPWRARTCINGQQINLGSHPTFEAARAAVVVRLASKAVTGRADHTHANYSAAPKHERLLECA